MRKVVAYLFLTFLFFHSFTYANSTISIAVVVKDFSHLNDSDKQTIHLHFSDILARLGYNIVDRDQLNSLLKEHENAKRENYLHLDDGEVVERLINKNEKRSLPRKMNQEVFDVYCDSMKNAGFFQDLGYFKYILDENGIYFYKALTKQYTIHTQALSEIEGIEEVLFVDIFKETNSSLKIYYSISDVFQKTILFSDKIIIDRSNVEKSLRENRSIHTDKINNIRPLSVYFYSFNDKKSFKFISKLRMKIEEGSIIYGVSKVKDHTPIQFKVSEMLSSNMISANIRSYKKKEVGPLKNIDFSEFDYYLSSIPESQKSQELALMFEWRKCCTPENFVDLIHSINKDYLILDCFHNVFLDYEKYNQTHELYLKGDSKYEEEKIQNIRYTFYCDKNNSFKVLKNGVKISTKTSSNSTFNDFVLDFLSLE